MRYCGIAPVRGALQLAMLEEVRGPVPPIHLSAIFFEPGPADRVAAELRSLGELVVAVAAPLRNAGAERACDVLLAQRGVPPEPPDREALRLAELLPGLSVFEPDHGEDEGSVPEGSYREFPLFETSADAVFCALMGRRLPAQRHPYGIQLRIEELSGDRVVDEGGDLWHRRIEELDAAACALCAHRYAVAHASWLGDPEEAVVVLPGATVPDEFPSRGVIPPVERLRLPPLSGG